MLCQVELITMDALAQGSVIHGANLGSSVSLMSPGLANSYAGSWHVESQSSLS